MAPGKTPSKKAVEIVEISSGDEAPTETQTLNEQQPLTRSKGLKVDKTTSLVTPAKLAVRVKDTGSVKHRHVSIEIPLPNSSRRPAKAESQTGDEEDVFKTPMERKQHITFDDSENDEFVTPREAPLGNPLESQVEAKADAKEEQNDDDDDSDDSDDDAAPEAISSHAAEAQISKAAQAATKAAKWQAAAQKRSRQGRDAFFKQQAEEKKRTQKPADARGESEEAEEGAANNSSPEKRKRAVPKLLPLELLDSEDEDGASDLSDSGDDGNSKRRRLDGAEGRLARAPKAPKDQKVGSTVFRVVTNRADPKLAPRVKKQTLNLREDLMKRNRLPQKRGGFFVK
ncbi:hypothetical protein B0T17DRAFT_495073 [Bombardia bombarda]|uniref:Uncharacterized protein n=1 Tax=Bombardia bombarda TaxID=252184 RepID=A0AA39WTY0_9PEZI|nr:hypothetical protein B0T17DRAFT_495073 [Bombardia bombarda]